jgi:phosphatidylethanolamine-binding protein (PEBP) family uncharacterized protein
MAMRLSWIMGMALAAAGLCLGARAGEAENPPKAAAFALSSPAVANGGALPKEFTGDGESATLPLAWKNAPAGTKSYALIMHHVDPEGKIKWYWILYDIPAATESLPKNVKDVGKLGNNSVNGKVGYAPPHSKGPGPKTYVYTLYALSAAPELSVTAEQVNREKLLAAMKGLILGSAELQVVYTRAGDGGKDGAEGDRPPPPPPPRREPDNGPAPDDQKKPGAER